MEIVRNEDGTLIVPVKQLRDHASEAEDGSAPVTQGSPSDTRLVHPGEGGYDEALAAWDLQQNPDRAPVVSTVDGRREAMALVHEIGLSSEHSIAEAVGSLQDPKATGEALRHVLVGGVHSVEDFSSEVAEAEGGKPLSAHETTKIIGEVLAELD